MYISELPDTAVQVSTGVWSDATFRKRYYLDPTDATLVSVRDWTEAEVAAYNQSQASASTNRMTLTTTLTADIPILKADIGAGTDPAGTTTINAILNEQNSVINAGPAPYVKALARLLRHTDKAVIADAKIDLNLVSDADIGA